MKTYFLILTFIIISHVCPAQGKRGNTWIVGGVFGLEAKFNGNQKPSLTIKYNNSTPSYPHYYYSGSSCISDSATGNLLFSSNGMRLFDTTGAIMQNGDHLVQNNYFNHNAYPGSPGTQGSIILPKGSNGEYYVFTSGVSDTTYSKYWTSSTSIKAPFDMISYCVVDMNQNNGLGGVVQKDKLLLNNIEMPKTMMQACKHSNGRDWWLLKTVGYDTNIIYRFLVAKDTIYGPYKQSFSIQKYGFLDQVGQMAFSQDGKKIATLQAYSKKLFLADFDRCTGLLSNPKTFTIPIDSTKDPAFDNQNSFDSISAGICFSPNNNFLYISKWWNIYQLEYGQTDSSLAWVNIKHGADTTLAKFQNYGQLQNGVDGRIYIGYFGGTAKQLSVIDYPNLKGNACGFCRKCFRLDNASLFGITAPPNMPNYELGPDGNVNCAPVAVEELIMNNEELVVYPNPASTKIVVRCQMSDIRKELYNSIGQLVLSIPPTPSPSKGGEVEIDVHNLSRGIYYLKVGNLTKKVVVE
jgi:hypothetical protein